MLAESALGATSQPRMVAATAAWEAPDHTPGRLLHSSVIPRPLVTSRTATQTPSPLRRRSRPTAELAYDEGVGALRPDQGDGTHRQPARGRNTCHHVDR